MAKRNSGPGILSYLGIAFIASLVFSRVGAAAYSRVAFGKPRLRFGRLSPSGVNVSLSIPVTNENPVSLPVDGLIGQLKYGPYTLFPFQLDRAVSIAAGETTEVPFSGMIRFAEVGGNLADLFFNNELWQDLRIEGQAYIKGVTIPFSNTISVG